MFTIIDASKGRASSDVAVRFGKRLREVRALSAFHAMGYRTDGLAR